MADEGHDPQDSHVRFSGLSVHAPEFIPQQKQTDSFVLYDPLSNTSYLLEYLFDDPEDLPYVLMNLEEIITKYLNVKQSLETIIDCILRKSIERNNVQYIAAQCFSQLCQNLTFKDIFIKRCNVMHKEFLSLPAFDEEIMNFTLLLSELSLSIKTPEGQLFKALLEAVVELLNKLLDFSNDFTIHCIQKVLKISGITLDSLVTEKFSIFFEKMKEKTITDCNSEKSRRILLELIILRSSGWNVNDSFPASDIAIQLSDIDLNGEESASMFYGATIFKDDFEHFLVPNEDVEPEIYEEYEKFADEAEIGMDSEMQQDYERFLEELEKKVP